MATNRRSTLQIHGLSVEVVRKPIKHLRLTVLPPDGRVRVSAPLRVSDRSIRAAVGEKLGWIRDKQRLCIERARHACPALVSGAGVWVWGERRRLRIAETDRKPRVALEGPNGLVMYVRSGTSPDARRALLEGWYRASLAEIVPGLIARWEPVVGEAVAEWRIRRMKTRWGSCNPRARRIWLSLELATKPPECTEYVLVHEMAHLLEASHDRRFYRLMDRFMPDWRVHRDALNRVPGEGEDREGPR